VSSIKDTLQTIRLIQRLPTIKQVKKGIFFKLSSPWTQDIYLFFAKTQAIILLFLQIRKLFWLESLLIPKEPTVQSSFEHEKVHFYLHPNQQRRKSISNNIQLSQWFISPKFNLQPHRRVFRDNRQLILNYRLLICYSLSCYQKYNSFSIHNFIWNYRIRIFRLF